MSESNDKPTMVVQFQEDSQNVSVNIDNIKSFEFALAMIELAKLALMEKRREVQMAQQFQGLQRAQFTQDVLGSLRTLPKRN